MLKRASRIGLAGIGTLAMAAVAAPMAHAEPIISNPDAKATLTVSKHLGNPTGDPADGQSNQIDLPGLEGVNFDVYKVADIDLTTNAGWSKASDFVKNTDPMTFDPGAEPTTTLTTGTDGKVTSGELPLGLYFVKENLASSNVKSGGEVLDSKSITPSAPFFVTLPMTDTGRDTPDVNDDQANWDYDVQVFPKNQHHTMTKEVIDGNVGEENKDAYQAGENLTYVLKPSITSTGPEVDVSLPKSVDTPVEDGEDVGTLGDDVDTLGGDDVIVFRAFAAESADLGKIGYYVVGDKMQDGMEFVSATVALPDGTELVAGTDYTETVSDDKSFIQWSLTEAGLNKIAPFNGQTLIINVVATVTAEAIPADGVVSNTAWFIPSNDWWVSQGNEPREPGTPPEDPNTPPETPPGVPSNEVISKFGDIALKKVSADDTTKTLAGAQFSLYRAIDGECTVEAVSGDPIMTAGPTATDGIAKFENLLYSQFYNGFEQQVSHDYCVVETVAPAGHELLAEPIKFTLGETTDGVEQVIQNAPSNLGQDLPLAGGLGTAIPMTALLLLGGGSVVALRSRRRETEVAEA